MHAYDEFFAGRLPKWEYPESAIRDSIEKLKRLYPWIKDLPYLGWSV
jgi:tryptophan synthase beta chain